jgi:hypothetical protein
MRFSNYCRAGLYLAIVLTACGRVDVTEETQSEYQPFVGTWKFISLTGENPEGDIILPYGEEMFGKLMYGSRGHMSVLLMKPGRPKFKTGDMLTGTPEEIKLAFEGFDAYCGTYKVDTDMRTVTHIIEGSRFPNWVGTEQVRYYEFSQDTLQLSAPITLGETEWKIVARLVKL